MNSSRAAKRPALRSSLIAGLVLISATALAGCSTKNRIVDAAPRLTLASYDSCERALDGFKTNAKKALREGRFGNSAIDDGFRAQDAPTTAPGAEKSSPDHSGTNTHEKGVDEPDIVKNDGDKIYVLTNTTLRVIGAKTRSVIASLDLGNSNGTLYPSQLLLHKGMLLVVAQSGMTIAEPIDAEAGITPHSIGSKIFLIDTRDTVQITQTLEIDGRYVDARQIGDTVRLVTQSGPTIDLPMPNPDDPAATLERGQAVIDDTAIDNWLPRYRINDGETTRVRCENVAHPAEFSASTMLSVFTLGFDDIEQADPVTITADGAVVYASEKTLYVANQPQPHFRTFDGVARDMVKPEQARTEFYAFDISRPGTPEFTAAGSVPGVLLNQYAMSEYKGHLRVATTSGETCCSSSTASESAIYVLRHEGDQLRHMGSVGGLGKGERIYAVRFVGATGYVVTFKQIDPLYTVDLSDPSSPKVRGELKITGYSAYLHPIDDGRLLGIGQEASEQGQRQGIQVSLFNVEDSERPNRISQHQLVGADSHAEYDPHAFLYWKSTGLLVIPISQASAPDPQTPAPAPDIAQAQYSALALHIQDDKLTELGRVEHPGTEFGSAITRSLIIDGTLWTISNNGAMASDIDTMAQQAWVAF